MKNTFTPADFTRVNNSSNGTPRYVCHFLKFMNEEIEKNIRDNFSASLAHNPLLFTSFCYDEAALMAKKHGGKKYRGKEYGGGIVFETFSIDNLCDKLNNQ